ncbi:putative glycosyltransferase protein [Rhizobium phage RHph_I46]|uniref:Putative glycosyltransferase protein n=1 Tax=Rhizobium phage RHph_I1_9 TaxID=2509729 RepID=A0A7S5UZM2_9CAUD|nr:putative glycosyltransferase protein [Rhizobium phage RHph_I1_9]QIG69686.1 putative glycosyltransferase protein [Rhizobium phage RHph_I46]QIG70967.1 putative glycosyltransferase protein [Rhizobium phage RHph_I9]QIG73553.1 putative glycosyltransferase protein [Rhizobium phage RHph_I1_9]QIG76306.1 putative glycosyltransferase protein [Rhizobium phage RHph_I34]
MRVLLINSFYYPVISNKGTGGSVRYCQSLHNVFRLHGHDIMHVTCKDSDILYPGQQHVLTDRVDIMDESRKAKSDVTKKMALEVLKIHNDFKPDVIIDNSNKRILRTFGSKVNTPYIFVSHNITPIGSQDTSNIRDVLADLKIFHVGVSKLQNEKYSGIFDDIIKVHLADSEFCRDVIQPSEDFAVHISRWDKYKAPWVVLNKFLKNIKDTKVHFFTTFDGNDLEGTEVALEKLRSNPRVIFHEDAPRTEMLDWVSRAKVLLGNPIESAGITALEANQNGVPYFVHVLNDKPLAQSEYLCSAGMLKSYGDNYWQDYCEFVLNGQSFERREKIAQWTRLQYGPLAFYQDHMRVIEKAIALRASLQSESLDLF